MLSITCIFPISYGGAYSPWFLPTQPDNDQADSTNTDDDYEFCATLALYRDDVTSGDYDELGLFDRLCAERRHFVCEVPAGAYISY